MRSLKWEHDPYYPNAPIGLFMYQRDNAGQTTVQTQRVRDAIAKRYPGNISFLGDPSWTRRGSLQEMVLEEMVLEAMRPR